MDLKASRRRGAELETAILDAAWEQLLERGYSEFTFESVAARAGTSRPVLYRRWADRHELMRATIKHAGAVAPVPLPDTGNLRDDVVTVLQRATTIRAGFAATLSVQLTEYFRETGTSFADMRSLLMRPGRPGMQLILERAAERGEVDLAKVTPRVMDLAMALMRHELMMTLTAVPDAVIYEIVDEIWLPLLQARGVLLSPKGR